MSLEKILSPLNEDIELVNQVIRQSLHSDVALINQISAHIINSGGKRMRPVLHLLTAGMIGEINEKNYKLAAIIEFIHTATLLHDDVVDQSTKRRNIKTANTVFGNAASVLVGDFIYSRSFQIMVGINNMDIMNILADTTNAISEGEIMQLLNINNAEMDEKNYFKVIKQKTAKLFEASSLLAGVINHEGATQLKKLSRLGESFGMIFQITDDILDYSGSESEIGKNVGDDLAEGKITLPLIYAIKKGTKVQSTLIKNSIKLNKINELPNIISILEETKAIELTRSRAEDFLLTIKDSITNLRSNHYKKMIQDIAEYAINRKA
ncbi:MAG: polyprenyl synthetase family protein [Methylophilaceae bacterium]|nr:polyprenyl synthetase family protein [Methylophilaceae bacterium]